MRARARRALGHIVPQRSKDVIIKVAKLDQLPPERLALLEHDYRYWREKWGFDAVNPDMDEVLRRWGDTEICWAFDPDGGAPARRSSAPSRGTRSVAEPVAGTIGAVVITHNRRRLLHECLEALLAQTRPPDAAVVVDNASTDGTPAMVAQEFPGVHVLALEVNEGGAGGFQEGMRRRASAAWR